jgi:signal transduction histidine kinase
MTQKIMYFGIKINLICIYHAIRQAFIIIFRLRQAIIKHPLKKGDERREEDTMSIRAKVFLVMVSTVVIITGANMGLDILFTRDSMTEMTRSSGAQFNNSSLTAAIVFSIFGVLISIIASEELTKVFQNIEKRNARLAELSNTVKNSSETKERFISNMRHDMRVPLNSVVRISEHMLGTGELKGNARDNLEKICNAGRTLLGIVNDVHDISRVESGKIELMPVEYDVPSLINEIVTSNITRIGDKQIKFNLQIDETLPSRLFGDAFRVELICNNLLNNAFKYTLEGNVDLSFACEREGDNIWLTIRVTDTGIGIRQKNIETLFSNNKAAYANPGYKFVEGAGLGLSITSMIARMMGGTVTAESEHGKGSVFTVRVQQGFVTEVPIGEDVAENLRRFHYCGKNLLDDVLENENLKNWGVEDTGTNAAGCKDEWIEVPEIDWSEVKKCLNSFGGDGETIRRALRSYA